METQVLDTKCSGCGERVDIGQTKCSWCGNMVSISAFNTNLKHTPTVQ